MFEEYLNHRALQAGTEITSVAKICKTVGNWENEKGVCTMHWILNEVTGQKTTL